MTDDVKAKLAARGFWRVEIRPTHYNERHVGSRRVLQHAIEKARVQFRGWDFPHIPREPGLPESQKWVGAETDWHVHVEIWRAFLSGQFVYRGGVWTDWSDQNLFSPPEEDWRPGRAMPIVSSLWSITEFCEFAARYSQTEAGDDSMYIAIAFHGLKGRRLVGDHERRVWFESYGPAQMQDFDWSRELSRSALIADSSKLAVSCCEELFSAFGYEPAPGILEGIQVELFELRRGS